VNKVALEQDFSEFIGLPLSVLFHRVSIFECRPGITTTITATTTTTKKLKLSHYTPRRRLGGEDIQLLLILDLGSRWELVVSVTLWPRFIPGESTPVPVVQEAGWASEPVWTQRLQEKSFRLCQESKLDRPVF
jgi:hypothetical protein